MFQKKEKNKGKLNLILYKISFSAFQTRFQKADFEKRVLLNVFSKCEITDESLRKNIFAIGK